MTSAAPSPTPPPYIRTSTLSYISRLATLASPDTLHLTGKNLILPKAILSGPVSLGRGSIVCGGATVRSSSLGRACLVSEGSYLEGCEVGSHCVVMSGCRLEGCVVRPCSVVLPGTVLRGGMVRDYARVGVGEGGDGGGDAPDNMEGLMEDRVAEVWERVRRVNAKAGGEEG